MLDDEAMSWQDRWRERLITAGWALLALLAVVALFAGVWWFLVHLWYEAVALFVAGAFLWTFSRVYVLVRDTRRDLRRLRH